MMDTTILCVILTLQIFTLGCLGYGVHIYIRARRVIHILAIKMECEDLLEQLLQEAPSVERVPTPTATRQTSDEVAKKRARLGAQAAGGRLKMTFKGGPMSSERVDQMTVDEINEAHARYEAQLGNAMSKSLGSSLLRLYASTAAMFLPLPAERQPALVSDLEEDPFVSAALSGACCELYYRYGMYLAPLTAALTTAKHCDWSVKDKPAAQYTTTDGSADDQPGGDRQE